MARRSLLRRPAVLLAAVLAGVLIAAAVDVARLGGLETWLAPHGVASPYDPRDELATVGTIEQLGLLLMVDPHLRFSDPDPARKAAIVEAWYRGLASRYPNADVEIVPETGHLIDVERPSLVIERVRAIVLAAREGP